ncbi:MAG: hypothetical protein Q7S94_04230 [Gallionella sp.]|nr:hypothetical protein [Gallionella sp.]
MPELSHSIKLRTTALFDLICFGAICNRDTEDVPMTGMAIISLSVRIFTLRVAAAWFFALHDGKITPLFLTGFFNMADDFLLRDASGGLDAELLSHRALAPGVDHLHLVDQHRIVLFVRNLIRPLASLT